MNVQAITGFAPIKCRYFVEFDGNENEAFIAKNWCHSQARGYFEWDGDADDGFEFRFTHIQDASDFRYQFHRFTQAVRTIV